MDDLLEMLEAAVSDGVVECPECGNTMEPDCPRCGECGKVNPLMAAGMI